MLTGPWGPTQLKPRSARGAAPGALPFLHPWGRPQLDIALRFGSTWACWGRDRAVPIIYGDTRAGSTACSPSRPVPHSPRNKLGLLEDSHHWGWLTPGDNIMSQWGAASLIGRILPLPSAAAVPGPSVQPAPPPPMH